jgi:hypothetical protein
MSFGVCFSAARCQDMLFSMQRALRRIGGWRVQRHLRVAGVRLDRGRVGDIPTELLRLEWVVTR